MGKRQHKDNDSRPSTTDIGHHSVVTLWSVTNRKGNSAEPRPLYELITSAETPGSPSSGLVPLDFRRFQHTCRRTSSSPNTRDMLCVGPCPLSALAFGKQGPQAADKWAGWWTSLVSHGNFKRLFYGFRKLNALTFLGVKPGTGISEPRI